MAPETDESLKNDVTTHFEFGENWAAYAQTISATRIEQAQTGLLNLFAAEEIRQATFLDIGCGSGLHALAALNLGAGQVTGIDIDPNSVATTQHTLKQYATRNAYECRVGNIFDPPFTPDQRFDIVYSWGVLHHTGSMWEAIDNAIKLVAPGGKLAIAIYVKTRFCGFWKAEKKLYTRLPKLLRWPIIWLFSALCFLRVLAQGKNPFKFIADYQTFRGMNWYHDRIDWLGGYPYESASREEIVDFVAHRGGRLIKAIGTQPSIGLLGTGCAEYVFEFSAT